MKRLREGRKVYRLKRPHHSIMNARRFINKLSKVIDLTSKVNFRVLLDQTKTITTSLHTVMKNLGSYRKLGLISQVGKLRYGLLRIFFIFERKIPSALKRSREVRRLYKSMKVFHHVVRFIDESKRRKALKSQP